MQFNNVASECAIEPSFSAPNLDGFYGVGTTNGSMRYLWCASGYIWSNGYYYQEVVCLGANTWSSVKPTLSCIRIFFSFFCRHN